MLVLLCLLPAARAAELEETLGLDALRRAAGAYLEGYLPARAVEGEDLGRGAEAILEGQRRVLPGVLRQAGRSAAGLLGVATLCTLARSVEELGGSGLDPVCLAAAATVCTVAVVDVRSLMALGREAMTQMENFSSVLLPTVTAACAAAGAPAAAVARQGAALVFLKLLLALADQVLLPLIYAYIAAVTAAAALGDPGLKRVGGLIKWVCTALLTALVSVFVLYLSFTGAVAGNADLLAQKAAKTALGSMVPVVGGILSDAAETVVAGAGVLKGTVGVLGLLTVLAICMAPFLQLGCHYLCYKCAAALAAAAAPGPAAELIDQLGDAFALLLGTVGGCGMILYVALVTSVKAVGG